ncbi:hypothetical protein HOY82DRAFT_488432, partial [Tuber indicum]
IMDPQFKLAVGILCFIGLISSLASGSEADVEINFDSMPRCSWEACAPVIHLLECGQGITIDCFCRKPSPLKCAWKESKDCWKRTEDWYDTQCPRKPHINLSEIPGCARGCFDKANVCLKQTYNCVCSQHKPDCSNSTTSKCISDEVGLYDAWYKKTCKSLLPEWPPSVSNSPPTVSPTRSASGVFTSSTSAPSSRGLSKGAISGVAIGSVAGALALGTFLFFLWKRKSHGSSRHEMEDYSNPKG